MSFIKQLVRTPFVRWARARDRQVAARNVPDVAVVAIFRQEAPFLEEWLRFHSGVGVGHFYLYNNFSTDNFREVLAPWIARGKVTLYDWQVKTGQLPAYRHCVKRHGMDTRWMAFIDIDEFLFSPAKDDIARVLADYREVPGLMIFSPYFGSAGHEQRPQVPITRAFTKRAPLTRTTAKTIANPRWIYAIRNVHAFKYWHGDAVDTDRTPFRQDTVKLDVLRLNHYWSRSLQDLRDKINRGDASTPVLRDPAWHFEFERGLNDEEDTSILPLLARIFPHPQT